MKVEVIEEGIKVKYVPGDEHLEECRNLGRRVGQRVLESLATAE
jgi:flavorubredoxin